MIKLFSESFCVDFVQQIFTGRGYDTQIDLNTVGTAHPLEFLVNQKPKDFRLSDQGHIRDFVKIDNTAIGLFQQSNTRRWVTVFMSEQYRFHPVRFDIGTVYDNKWCMRPIRMGMYIARRHFFADPGSPTQHDTSIRFRDLIKLGCKIPKRSTLAQHLGRAGIFFLERDIFAAQAGCFHRATNNHQQLINVEWFFNKIIGTLLDSCDGYFNIAVTRDNHDRHLGVI